MLALDTCCHKSQLLDKNSKNWRKGRLVGERSTLDLGPLMHKLMWNVLAREASTDL